MQASKQVGHEIIKIVKRLPLDSDLEKLELDVKIFFQTGWFFLLLVIEPTVTLCKVIR